MSLSYRSYLGDGVYVGFDGFGVALTSEDGVRILDRIVLEPEVLGKFEAYMVSLRRELSAPAPAEPKEGK